MSYEAWLDAYESVYLSPGSLATAACPNCRSTALRLRFLVQARGAAAGSAVFWCASCRQGVVISRVPVPDWADLVVSGEGDPAGADPIPDFAIVPPDIDFGDETEGEAL